MLIDKRIRRLPPNTAACLGAFDGFHLGHRALLQLARSLAPLLAVVTFDPHPAQLLAPDRAPRLLQTHAQRARVCAQLGVDRLVLLPFDEAMAAMSPDTFAVRVLSELAPTTIVVGEDFRFGADRSGYASSLARMLAPHGIAVSSVQAVGNRELGETRVSSTQIRAHVEAGRLRAAAGLLGRWYSVEGTVIRGAGRGRDLGFPTANLVCEDRLLPPPGTYAAIMARPRTPSASEPLGPWPAVAHVGPAPTFQAPSNRASLEVHAIKLNLSQDKTMYGEPIEVWFVARLRDTRRFTGREALVQAIGRDVASATSILDHNALIGSQPRPLD
ncbi:MAG: riboflavin biosynthesis protein RibF [Nannocystaceae bacterium]